MTIIWLIIVMLCSTWNPKHIYICVVRDVGYRITFSGDYINVSYRRTEAMMNRKNNVTNVTIYLIFYYIIL